MSIPTQFGVNVKTPDPVKVTIDVSERTMILVGFVAVLGAILAKKKFIK